MLPLLVKNGIVLFLRPSKILLAHDIKIGKIAVNIGDSFINNNKNTSSSNLLLLCFPVRIRLAQILRYLFTIDYTWQTAFSENGHLINII